MKCRVCSAPIHSFMSFGKMPIANAFIEPDDIENEYFYELAPAVCEKCGMFQLMEQPDPKRLFHDGYPFYTGTSQAMDYHFAKWAHELPPGLVVEIGSNDGTFLKHIKAAGHICFGFEPAKNLADIACKAGLAVSDHFFHTLYGGLKADVIVAANVVCHIPDLNRLATDVAASLNPNGQFIFEEPYLPDMLQKTAFDQIYDEHVFMFSASSVAKAFKPHGLYLIDCEHQPTHGGSMRYTLAHSGSPSLRAAYTLEQEALLAYQAPYQEFAAQCENKRDKLRDVIFHLHKFQEYRIVGYGATSKSTTILNYCGFDADDIDYICDTTPIKHGKLTPGTHIPIRPYEDFVRDYPDYAILFAWNHAAEIMAKEKKFPGKWINYVPEVSVS